MKKSALQYLLVLAIFNGLVFANGYFFNFKIPMPWWFIGPIAIVSASMPWIKIKLKRKATKYTNITKILIAFLASALTAATMYASAFATMIVPGSREHNYVMYEVCLPAMRERYDQLPQEERPNYFDIHTDCEQNVWAGRKPLDGFK